MSNLATKFGVKIIVHPPEISTSNGTVERTQYDTGKNALISAELILVNRKLFHSYSQIVHIKSHNRRLSFVHFLWLSLSIFCLLSKLRITAKIFLKTFKGIKVCSPVRQQHDVDLCILQVNPKVPSASVAYTTVMLEP